MAKLPKNLLPLHKKNAQEMADKIGTAFPWDRTPQGARYWQEVQRNLRSLAEYEVTAYNTITDVPGTIAQEYDDDAEPEPGEIGDIVPRPAPVIRARPAGVTLTNAAQPADPIPRAAWDTVTMNEFLRRT